VGTGVFGELLQYGEPLSGHVTVEMLRDNWL
jgi:hypothetical protein